MNRNEIYFMSACDLVEKIKIQEFSSLEITEAIIERIEEINPIINAYCTTTFELALEMAKKSDKALKKGKPVEKLHGVPFSIKDLIETKGIRTTYGCKIFENFIPYKDELVVKRLKKSGAIILGKTNTPCFGSKGVTDNVIFGTTRNPWNLERTPGGSSGGAAAAIASGLGPLALGSDGLGSIRAPCCFCGVYGLKPSFGRIPHNGKRTGGIIDTFASDGPIVRCVKDAALMLDVMAGEDDSDRYSLPKPNVSFLEKLEDYPKGIKIGYSLDLGYAKLIDPEVKKIFLDAVQKFEEFNWSVDKSRIRIKHAESVIKILSNSSIAYFFKTFPYIPFISLNTKLNEKIKTGLNCSIIDLKMAELKREKIYNDVCRYLKKHDILLTPTMACLPFELERDAPDKIDGKKISGLEWTPFTYPFNVTGHPTASIPCGWSKEGLPIGMQIIGQRLDDMSVLQVSKAFEKIAPWQDKKPKFN